MVDKQEFLVAYDYGMGGLWAIIYARSEDEIKALYPELGIARSVPEWMTTAELDRVRDQEWHDIDGAPWGVLNVVLADRSRGDDNKCDDS